MFNKNNNDDDKYLKPLDIEALNKIEDEKERNRIKGLMIQAYIDDEKNKLPEERVIKSKGILPHFFSTPSKSTKNPVYTTSLKDRVTYCFEDTINQIYPLIFGSIFGTVFGLLGGIWLYKPHLNETVASGALGGAILGFFMGAFEKIAQQQGLFGERENHLRALLLAAMVSVFSGLIGSNLIKLMDDNFIDLTNSQFFAATALGGFVTTLVTECITNSKSNDNSHGTTFIDTGDCGHHGHSCN